MSVSSGDNHKKKLKIASIVAGVSLLVVAVVGALYVTKPNLFSPKYNDEAAKRALAILTGQSESSKPRVVQSRLGFSVAYDTQQYNGFGVVQKPTDKSGVFNLEQYRDAELDEKRNYTKVTIQEKLDSSLPENKFRLPAELDISTNYRKNYFDRSKLNEKYKSMSDLDVLIESEKLQLEKPDSLFKFVSGDKITLNDHEFYRMVKSQTRDLFTTKKTTYEVKFLAVNDGSPYFFEVRGADFTKPDDPKILEMESLLTEVRFTKHDDGSLVRNSARLVAADINKDISQASDRVTDIKSVELLARSQIATVRIGTVRCADATLTAANSTAVTLANSCNAGIGSGAIVSSDGYVSTNGHVVDISQKEIAKGFFYKNEVDWGIYLNFLIDSGMVSRESLQAILQRIEAGEKQLAMDLINLIDQVPSVTLANRTDSFNVQTSDTPMRLNLDIARWEWRPSNGNYTKARLIDFEFDSSVSGYSETSKLTDVALLKIDGDFPAVKTLPLDKFKTGSRVTAVGFPGAVDGGPMTKGQRTVPTVTQGYVRQIGTDGGGHLMMMMSAKIAPGNSGGPAFDDNGVMVGLNTYGRATCGSETDVKTTDCFGAGIARDSADLVKLARDNSVQFKTNGAVNTNWNRGVDAFLQGRYSTAKQSFDKVNNAYPNNYLVSSFTQAAGSQKDAAQTAPEPDGESTDTRIEPLPYDVSEGSEAKESSRASSASSAAALLIILIIGAGVFVISAVAAVIIFLVIKKSQNNQVPGYPYAQNTYGYTPTWQQDQNPTYPSAVPGTPPVQPRVSYQTPPSTYYQQSSEQGQNSAGITEQPAQSMQTPPTQPQSDGQMTGTNPTEPEGGQPTPPQAQ